MPHYVASDLGLHCLPMTLLHVSRYEWVKVGNHVRSPTVWLLSTVGVYTHLEPIKCLLWICLAFLVCADGSCIKRFFEQLQSCLNNKRIARKNDHGYDKLLDAKTIIN